MPVYFDLEEKKQFNLGKEKVSAIMRAFLEKVESAGYFTGLYGSESSLTTHTADDIKSRYTIWLAHWVNQTNYSGAYAIRNTCYVGDDFYPAIISRHTFSKANAELMRRAEKHTKKKRLKPPPVYSEFSFIQPDKHFDDPVQQAEYMYSLIEVKI